MARTRTVAKRRVRTGASSTSGTRRISEDKLKEKLKKIADIDKKVAALHESRQVLCDELEQDMKDSRTQSVSYGLADALLEDKYANSKTVVDEEAIKRKFGAKVLAACKAISIAKMKEVLSTADIDSVTTKIPGKKKGTFLKISYRRKNG